MSTEWFTKTAGSEFCPSAEEEGMVLIGADRPDWVNVPDHPGLPGGKRRCLGVGMGPCYRPGHEHRAKHYILEGLVSCCECEVDGVFQWYKNGGKNDR